MRVTVLGSGTAVPNPDRFPAGYLVQREGQNLLVDLGPGVLRRVAKVGLDLDQIDGVLFTHYHTDHCADIAALLFGLRNPRYAGRSPLRLVGAPGLRALLQNLNAAWPWVEAKGYELCVDEIGPGPFRSGELECEAIAIEHTKESLGYRITAPGGAVAAFSGDAVFCGGLEDLARDADLFVCDSAFPTAEPGIGHMTPTEAGRAAAAAGAKTLCLTHFYPECDGHDLVAEARTEFGGEIVLAADLLEFDLGRTG